MALVEQNIRKEISQKLGLAIDCEEIGNKQGAYINYLDGLSLVVSTLKKDNMIETGILTVREKRTLVGFAKHSIDRLLIILDKSDKLEIEKNLDEILDLNSEPSNIALEPRLPEVNTDLKININSNWDTPVIFEENEQIACSPLDMLQKENSILIARYNNRMKSAPTDQERQKLQLELERQLVENNAIATRRQVIWTRQREKVTVQFKDLAQQKFGICSQVSDPTVQDINLKKQETFVASLQYALDNAHLSNLQQEFHNDACNTTLSSAFITYILSDSKHPVGNLLRQMQLEVAKNITSYLSSNGETDKIDHQTHLKSVSNVIKNDINMLETLLKALYEDLLFNEHLNIVTEKIHYFYFGILKRDLICLIRFCTKETEEMLQNEMNLFEEKVSVPLDADKNKIAVSKLKTMMTHHSPCGMLDLLVATIKTLACNGDEDLACNSLGADDLLPRLLEVVLSSQEYTLPAHILFMESFLPSFKALGEEGYSLTLLQSVVVCITSKQYL